MAGFGSALSMLTMVALGLYCLLWLIVFRLFSFKGGQSTWGFLWGALFAALFYGFLPIGWFRYGFKKALSVLLLCAVSIFLLALYLCDDPDDRMLYGLLVAVPIRAIAGLIIAWNDSTWRHRAKERRRLEKLRKLEVRAQAKRARQGQVSNAS